MSIQLVSEARIHSTEISVRSSGRLSDCSVDRVKNRAVGGIYRRKAHQFTKFELPGERVPSRSKWSDESSKTLTIRKGGVSLPFSILLSRQPFQILRFSPPCRHNRSMQTINKQKFLADISSEFSDERWPQCSTAAQISQPIDRYVESMSSNRSINQPISDSIRPKTARAHIQEFSVTG